MANAKHKKNSLLCRIMKDKEAFSNLSKYLFIEKRKHKKVERKAKVFTFFTLKCKMIEMSFRSK